MTDGTKKGLASPTEPNGTNSLPTLDCEGCPAATSDFYCDLGAKTVIEWKEHGQKGVRPLQSCPRPKLHEDYLLEHLKRM